MFGGLIIQSIHKQNFYKYGSYGIRGLNGLSGSNFVDKRFLADFPLVGSNEKASNEFCNVFSRNFLCDKVWLHEGKVVPEGFVGTILLDRVIGKDAVVVKPHANHCFDPLCPLCCYAWAKRAAKRVLMRFEVFDSVFGAEFELRHIVVSIPKFDFDKPLSFLRRMAVNFCESVGVVGGLVIYHSKRDKNHRWFFSPHFHVLGYVKGGLIDGGLVSRIYGETEYVLVNLEKRLSVLGTLLYQLSHAAVVGRSKMICYFGELVFNKGNHEDLGELLRANEFDAKLKAKSCLCPVCGSGMVHGCRSAKSPVFDYVKFEDEFLLDKSENWVVVPDRVFSPKYKGGDDGGGCSEVFVPRCDIGYE
jgi:hypothetical protein